MKCEDALVRMLDAEPRDLVSGAGDLGIHIGSCQRCSAVAQTLSSETQRLARAFSEPHGIAAAVRHRNKLQDPRQFVSPVLAIAASLVLWVVLRSMTSSPLQVVPSAPQAPVARASQPAKPVQRIAPALVRIPQAVAVMPVATQAVAVSGIAPEREPEREAEVVAPDVSVSPEPGTLAAVVRAREARVTVVLFKK